MSEETTIAPNEEITCFVGMPVIQVMNILDDTGVQYRVLEALTKVGSTHIPNRVNLVIDNTNVVIRVFYG